jgi:DNA polymerase III alpha subunit (gram-positive type)
MKIAITDVETTGLDCNFHEIIEIGAVIFDSETFEIEEEINIKVSPQFPDRIDPAAQAVNGYNEKDWLYSPSLLEAMEFYQLKTDGCMFSAHNMIFDYGFIQAAFKKVGLEDKFLRHKIDLLTLAWAKIPHHKMRGWSLKKVCEALDIAPEPDIHRAVNGAMSGYLIYKKLMQ